jgi:hypothetical protein
MEAEPAAETYTINIVQDIETNYAVRPWKPLISETFLLSSTTRDQFYAST